jgi:hypothetical protein
VMSYGWYACACSQVNQTGPHVMRRHLEELHDTVLGWLDCCIARSLSSRV